MKIINYLILAGLFMIGINSCKKDSVTLTAPTVISTDPLNNATNVVLNKIVTATFSVPMDPSTLTPTTFTIKLDAMPVAGTVSYTGTTASFTPSNNLLSGTTYTASITSGAKDVPGTALANDYVWTFNTVSLVTRNETVSLGAGYINDIFYRLSDGLITSVPRSNWDIAFSVSTREAAILTNGASGVTLKVYPTSPGWTWTTPVNISGYDNWASLYNSDTTWSEGAFNMNATGHPNYGWGVYNSNSHNIEGNALYIIKLRNGNFKKIWIEMKYSSLQKYSFRYADIDGSNEQVVSNMDISASKANYVYYSLQDNLRVDREPDATNWDIVFTKWMDKSLGYYPVTGVLQNIGIRALESTDVDPLSEVMTSTGYLSAISTIGSDWKTINMTTYQYTIDETRVFLVKDKNNKIYRIRFKTFEGSSTGNLSFDISTIK